MSSLKLSDEETKKLKEFIKDNNLKIVPNTNKYEIIRVKDGDINLILYYSQKLVIKDSPGSQKLLNTILKKETGYTYFIGSDETGKGEWYGPLVVVAAALKPEEIIELRKLGIKDSKTLKTSKIKELAQKLLNKNITYKALVLKPDTYNKLYKNFKKEGKNLNDLLAWAHSRVIQDVLGRIKYEKVKVIIDEFDHKKTDYRLRGLDESSVLIIQKKKGESEIPVAAASILAKYLFENVVEELNVTYGINLKINNPQEIKEDILPKVAKEHFSNVKRFLK